MAISMQTISMIPANHSKIFQTRRSSFKCRQSFFNPSSMKSLIPPSSTSSVHYSAKRVTDLTRLHLSNLDNLLQKTSDPIRKQENEVSENELTEKGGRAMLQGFNLARIWPEMKAAEDMSPKNLNRLKRLLSKTPEYSPRNNLGSRWREYHGCYDWVGLLDPLDENLRREVVRYGEFVQAAYHAFHSDPAMSTNEPPLPRHVALPDKSYKVTKSLYATSSVGLPDWVDNVAPDLGWMTQRSSWIGYVAVCDDRNEIQRMGRRDIVIALRGTSTCLEWAENVRTKLVQMTEPDNSTQTNPKVEHGFLSLYKTRGAQVPSMAESIVDEIHRLTEKYKGETLSITVTGHSLGAALALLVADEISSCAPNVPPVAVFSFGGPRVGNKDFATRIKDQNVRVLRVVNNQDIITRVPGIFPTTTTTTATGNVQEQVQEQGQKQNSNVSWMLNALDKNNPWAYSHVGTELRVDTRRSPYLKPNADVACCHDLEAYLHLVDGFMASNCPFRANAKRSLWKLVNEQSSNVKKLYTSNVKGLSLKLDRNNSMSMSSCLPSPSN